MQGALVCPVAPGNFMVTALTAKSCPEHQIYPQFFLLSLLFLWSQSSSDCSNQLGLPETNLISILTTFQLPKSIAFSFQWSCMAITAHLRFHNGLQAHTVLSVESFLFQCPTVRHKGGHHCKTIINSFSFKSTFISYAEKRQKNNLQINKDNLPSL